MTYHEKHTELEHKIRSIKSDLSIAQDVLHEAQKDVNLLELDLEKAEDELSNLTDEEEELSDEEILQIKADGAHEDWLKDKEDTDALYESKEYQEKAQQELDDVNSFNKD